MKLKHHIIIGKEVIDNIDINILKEFGMHKLCYLFGTIYPDINCVYPAHRLSTTNRKFYILLNKLDRTNSSVAKSFRLGVITHYMCDYFCFAHNNESLGLFHKIYEEKLLDEYKKHLKGDWDYSCDIVETWSKCKQNNNERNIEKYIVKQLSLVNKQYNKESKTDKGKGWYNDTERMHRDLSYCSYIVINVTLMLMTA